MTPYELILAINVHNEKQKQKSEDEITLAYLNAYWQRVNKLPSLKKILGNEQQPVKKEMTAEEMLKEVMKINKVSGGTSN
jgi:tRNA splicing ligase